MEIQNIKMVAAGLWVLTALIVAIAADVTWPIKLGIAVVGVLPPLGVLLWGSEPAQTMSESIDEARR